MLVSFDRLKRVISVSFDSFINCQHIQFNSILILLIEFVHDMDQHSGIFSSTCAYRNLISGSEQFVLDDSLVNLCLKAVEETVLTDRLKGFRSFYHSFVGFADLTLEFGHSWWSFLLYIIIKFIKILVYLEVKVNIFFERNVLRFEEFYYYVNYV